MRLKYRHYIICSLLHAMCPYCLRTWLCKEKANLIYGPPSISLLKGCHYFAFHPQYSCGIILLAVFLQLSVSFLLQCLDAALLERSEFITFLTVVTKTLYFLISHH